MKTLRKYNMFANLLPLKSDRTYQKPERYRYWLFSILLEVPVILLYLSHYLHGFADGLIPTGFIKNKY